MIRRIVIPEKRLVNVSFSVPENYIGKEMEVIAFTTTEGLASEETAKKIVSFNAVAIDTTGYKFNRDEANKR